MVNCNFFLKVNSLIFIIFIPFIINMTTIRKENFLNVIQSYSNEIIIKVKGVGWQNIISPVFNPYPNEVYLNNVITTEYVSNTIYIPDTGYEINSIKLIWSNELYSLFRIFENMTNVTEVDLSKFDTSKINNMCQMFWGCTSLTSINLNNINTSLVETMRLMFAGCSSLKELDISNFDTSRVGDMDFMFADCKEIKSLYLSNFDTSKVSHFEGMFKGMENLDNLNIKNFDTSKAINMQGMFYQCISLTTLDLSSFDTSLVTDMSLMFYDNYKLNFLDLSNFETSEVTNMNYMFANCKEMTSLNISNFKTPKLNSMFALFLECNHLTSIDISSFDTTLVTSMENLFFGCNAVSILNLSNFDTSNVESMSNMFSHTDKLTSIILSSFNTSSVKHFNQMFRYSVGLTSIDLSHFDTSKAEDMFWMFIGCWNLKSLNLSNFDTHLVENMEYMFYDCISLTSLDISSFNTIKTNNMNNMFNTNEKLEEVHLPNIDNIIQTILSLCKNLKYIDIKDNFEYIDYFFSGEGFDDIPENIVLCINKSNLNATRGFYAKLIQKRCHVIYCGDDWKSKQKRMVYGTNLTCVQNCLNYKYELNYWCYPYCPQNADFCKTDVENTDINTNIDSIINKDTADVFIQTSITDFSIYTEENKTNIDDIDYITNINYINNDSLILTESNINNNEITEEIDLTNYTNTYINIIDSNRNSIIMEKTNINNNNNIDDNENTDINGISDEFLPDYILKIKYNKTYIDKGFDIIYKNKNYIFTITNTINQRNNENNNGTIIDLDQCEAILKHKNNISENDSLYIMIIDTFLDELKFPIVDYSVYYPFTNNNLTKLDLNPCKNVKVKISFPINISTYEIDQYNLSSDLYNDLCYTLINDKGIDKPLKERRKESLDNNIYVCEENCIFTEYDIIEKRALCSCYTKIELPIISEIRIDKQKLLSNFKNIKNIANFKMLNCLHLMFNKNNIFINSANYIFIFLFILSLISIFGFILYNYPNVRKDITKIWKEKISYMNMKAKKNTNKNINLTKNSIKLQRKIKEQNFLLINKTIKNQEDEIKSKVININHKKGINTSIEQKEGKKLNDSLLIENKENKHQKKNFLNYNDIEMNFLSYKEALKKDKRTYIQYYISLIKTKHILVFSFYNIKDYNSQFIKIYIFFFTFYINCSVSAMFYTDSTMSKIYIDEGSFDFTYQLPIMIYSIIISSLLKTILSTLGLYGKNIIELKIEKQKESQININKEIKKIKIKIILFFFITYIILIFLWLYLGCFCAVYSNTQVHLLSDVSSSFFISFITPFFIYLLPGIFRIASLKIQKNKKNEKSLLFKISKVLELL